MENNSVEEKQLLYASSSKYWFYFILLLAFTIILIFIVAKVPWEINLTLLFLEIIILKLVGMPFKKTFRMFRRLLPFLSMIFFISIFFTGGKNILWGFTIYHWQINSTFEGLQAGAISVLDFLTLICISGFYQLSFFENSLANLSRKLTFFAPIVLVHKYLSVENSEKSNESKEKKKFKLTSALSLKLKLNENFEKFNAFTQEQNFQLSQKTILISSISLLLFTTKLVKILPGIPFASGQRLIFTLPLLFFASRKAGFFAATWVAFTYGFLTLIFGQQGGLGILELFRLVLLGFTVDIFQISLPTRGWRLFLGLTISGAMVGLLFAFFGIFWATLFNTPNIIYLFAAPRFIFNTIFGAISGSLSYTLLSDK